MMDTNDEQRPERRTALIAQQLSRYDVDVAALQETRLADEGSLEEHGQQYTFFWKGKSEGERREHGVGFAIKSKLVRTHNLIPNHVHERITTLRIPLNKDAHVTIV